MRILFATYQTPESFLENLHVGEGEGDSALLAVATRAEFEHGEPLILEIGYPGLPNRILIRALSATPPAGQDEDTGLKWFSLDPDEELQRDFLIAVAAGRANATLQRRHQRFPVRMAARVKVEGDDTRGSAEVADMAMGGVALKTAEPLPDGTRVTVVLEPGDGSAEIEISGQVVWNRQDDDTAEVGIQFEKSGGESMRRLRQMIRGVTVSGETLE
jgi:Tfp pilus assembly protein PilZ